MTNNKKLELPHRETVINTNTLQTKPFDNQKIEIMSNNKKTSIDWFFDQLVINRIIIINGSTYWDKVKGKYEILLEQAREMYQEEIEAAAIISSAKQSTKAANQKTEAFAIGYDQGYNRALELIEWQIKHKLKTTK